MKVKSRNKRTDVRKEMPVQLPEDYPWKVVNKLSHDLREYLDDADFSKLDEIIRKRDFGKYLELAEEWGLQSITPADTSTVEIRAKYLLASLVKKFRFPTDRGTREERALRIFHEAELFCKTYNEERYTAFENAETEFGVKVFHHARLFLSKLLGDRLPGHRALLDRSRHGPGATIGTKKGMTSLYSKYAEWPYSCTIDAYRYARFAIETDQRWFGALQNAYRARFGIPKHMPLDMSKFWASVVNVVDGNRIAFVPKDAQKERTIAIEPTLNLYLQLGVDGFIRHRLKRWGVDLDSQTKNQELARLGSLRDDDESSCTIDLSAASDSVSLKLCELLLPSEWCSYLMDLRSPSGTVGDDLVVYEKISSMGNGYTFALESAIFTALVYAVMRASGEPYDHRVCAIFGDDLIVPKKHYFKVVEALRLAGFRLNLDKTFSAGPVRESCGADWFRGLPVRPVFFTDIPTDVGGLLTDYNRLKRLLSLRFGVESEESATLSLYRKWIPDKARCLVGPYSDESFDSYMHSAMPPASASEHYRKHYVYRYRRLITKPVPQKGQDFHMRKLMSDLRGASCQTETPWSKQPWWEWMAMGKGSRFTVTRRNSLIVGYTYSRTSYWCDSYAEAHAG